MYASFTCSSIHACVTVGMRLKTSSRVLHLLFLRWIYIAVNCVITLTVTHCGTFVSALRHGATLILAFLTFSTPRQCILDCSKINYDEDSMNIELHSSFS
jgi:hypothetical protein